MQLVEIVYGIQHQRPVLIKHVQVLKQQQITILMTNVQL